MHQSRGAGGGLANGWSHWCLLSHDCQMKRPAVGEALQLFAWQPQCPTLTSSKHRCEGQTAAREVGHSLAEAHLLVHHFAWQLGDRGV